MPSLATRLAAQVAVGVEDSLAWQIEQLHNGSIAQADLIDVLIETGEVTNAGVAQMLIQNNAIIRLLCSIFLALDGDDLPALCDDDVESLIQEITP